MMPTDPLLERMRSSRGSGAVIKTRFVTLVGASGGRPILAFEGDDDKIVYGRWINRINPNLKYEVFVCKGKSGVKSLKFMLDRDLGSIAKSSYMFVDRDFDDLQDFVNDVNVFMTDRHSVENYFVSADVVNSLLRDELPLHDNPGLRAEIVSNFCQDYRIFLGFTQEVNLRLFLALRLSIACESRLTESIADYATVSVGAVTAGRKAACEMVVCSIPTDDADVLTLKSEFDRFNPEHRYRGKNAYLFFRRWLTSLIDHMVNKSGPFIGVNVEGKGRESEITLGALASKSTMPMELPRFIDAIVAL